MNLIDTHCHLYSEEFIHDIQEVIKRGEAEGVSHFFLPAIDSITYNSMIELEKKFPDKCIAMMGLHPCSVKDNYVSELNFVEKCMTERKFAAVGEIGLDFYWDKTYSSEQFTAFKKQIELALHYELPIVIHTRKAMKETIAIVKEYAGKGLTGIFHCFGGTYEEAKEIIQMGFYLGIGGILTYKNAGLVEIISKIDLNYLVLETDAPYLTPVPFRGKRNESSYLKYVVEKLAAIKQTSKEEIARITTANAKKIFNFLAETKGF